MCEVIKPTENISIALQRDVTMRATEVVVVNNGAKGEWGIKLVCFDNGKIEVSGAHELLDGVDII